MTQKRKKKKKQAKALVVQGRGSYVIPRAMLKGRGAYTGVGNVAQSLGSLLGPTAGNIAGSVGDIFSHIFGMGKYKVKKNTMMTDNGPPIMHNMDEKGTRITHREYLGDILGSIDFSGTRFPLNPGQGTTFPWLSRIAKNFEQYEIMGMCIYFKTTSGNAVSSDNPALGNIIIATQYDALDPPFTNKQEMESYQFCSSTVACANGAHPIECARSQTTLPLLYVRPDGGALNSDLRFYDMGVINVYTQGMQTDNATVGELWVTYDVRFVRPKLGVTSNTVAYWESDDRDASLGNSTGEPFNDLYATQPNFYEGAFTVYGSPGVTFTSNSTCVLNSPGYFLIGFYQGYESETDAHDMKMTQNSRTGPSTGGVFWQSDLSGGTLPETDQWGTVWTVLAVADDPLTQELTFTYLEASRPITVVNFVVTYMGPSVGALPDFSSAFSSLKRMYRPALRNITKPKRELSGVLVSHPVTTAVVEKKSTKPASHKL